MNVLIFLLAQLHRSYEGKSSGLEGSSRSFLVVGKIRQLEEIIYLSI
jgi:hypothetical protein